ncbi:hypothetical protein P0203_22685 [Escherichia coli]|nr:hypothetical protein [Escherichia coli]
MIAYADRRPDKVFTLSR